MVGSDGVWSLNNRSGDTDTFIHEGDVSAYLNLQANGRNDIVLIANEETAYFFLNNDAVEKVVHDAKVALHALNRAHEELNPDRKADVIRAVTTCGTRYPWNGGVRIRPITEDTLLAAYLLDPNRGKYPIADIARDVLDLAPTALFFNYGNPMAPICRAIRKATGANVTGVGGTP